jgi:ABC-2 type transport system ATP-binding protein
VTAVRERSPAGAPAVTAAPAITARAVRLLYANGRGLQDFSLEVPRGSIFGLLGANGSGKTTFLHLVAGLLKPQVGELTVLGQASPRQPGSERISYVFQQEALDHSMTLRETLALSATLYSVLPSGSADDVLSSLGLTERLDDRVGSLSGGLRRRLELARALLQAPRLLVLDEPSLGLDIDARHWFWSHLGGLSDADVTVLVASNDVSDVNEFCTEVALISGGQCVAQDHPERLTGGVEGETLLVRWPGVTDDDLQTLRQHREVTSITRAGDSVQVAGASARALLSLFVAFPGPAPQAVELRKASLADVYFRLTGTLINDREERATSE